MSDFNWSGCEDVVVPQVDAVAVYLNDNGDIVIRQRDSMGGDDSVIIFPVSAHKAVIGAIKEVAKP
jgi:hypothetical protein